jgi:hypothetical protein
MMKKSKSKRKRKRRKRKQQRNKKIPLDGICILERSVG